MGHGQAVLGGQIKRRWLPPQAVDITGTEDSLRPKGPAVRFIAGKLFNEKTAIGAGVIEERLAVLEIPARRRGRFSTNLLPPQ
jgi:hypothetical protein